MRYCFDGDLSDYEREEGHARGDGICGYGVVVSRENDSDLKMR